MKTFLLFSLAFLICPVLSMGQFVTQEDTSFVFEGNNFRWHQSTTGHLFFHQENGRAGLEVPKDGNNHSVFAHALWPESLVILGDRVGGLVVVVKRTPFFNAFAILTKV